MLPYVSEDASAEQGEFIPGFHDQAWDDGPPWEWESEHDLCDEHHGVRMNIDRKTGTIARLIRDHAFGFITCPEDQRDYFFHQAQLEGCTLAQLEVGDAVSFLLADGKKGIEAQQVQTAAAVRASARSGNR